MEAKTTVISARIPVDIAEMVKKTCLQRNISMSNYLTQVITDPQTPTFSKGGTVNTPGIAVNEDLKAILSGLGGLGIGMVVYKLLNAYLPRDKFTEEEIESYSFLGSMACGIGSAFAINKIIKND